MVNRLLWLVVVAASLLAAFCTPAPALARGSVQGSDGFRFECSGRLGTKSGSSPSAACDAAQSGTDTSPDGTVTVTWALLGCADSGSGAATQGAACSFKKTYCVSGAGCGVSQEAVYAQAIASHVCPDHATLTGDARSCTCDGGYKPNGTGLACVPDCEANATASSGYFDIGAAQGANPVMLGCSGICEVVFDGVSPSGSALVGGQKHWYAKGQYIYTGGGCSASKQVTGQVGNGSPAKPADTCGANQGSATMNGKTVCVDQASDGKQATDDSATKEGATTEKTTTTNPDGSTTTKETTTKIGADGSRDTTVTTTTTRGDGSQSVESTTTKEGPDGKGEDGDKSECEKNAAAAGCGGDPADIGQLYTARDRTMTSVLSEARTAFMSSPIGSAVGGFFVVSAGGSCPSWTGHIPFINADVVFDQFCTASATTALALLKACLLVVASFFAFRAAVE